MRKKMKCFAVCFAAMLVALGFTACNEAAPDAPEDKVLLSLSTSLNNDNWEDESRVNRDDNERSILSFAEGDTIRVDAWYMPQGGSSATDEPDVFRKQLMTYTNSLWDYSPKKYWTNIIGDKMAFFAYYLDGANCIVHEDWNSSSGYPKMEFVGPNKYCDILVAPVKILSKEELVEGKVPLQFNHIMSRFKFEIRYWDTEEDNQEWTKLFIEKIIFWNHPKSANFLGFDSGVAKWEITDYPTGSGVGVINDVTVSWGENFTPLPEATQFHYPFVCKHASDQDGHIDNAKLGFTVYKENENGDRVNLSGSKNYFELYFDEVIEAGKTYVFKISIKPNNGIELTVSVEKSGGATDWWTSGSNPDYNISESY